MKANFPVTSSTPPINSKPGSQARCEVQNETAQHDSFTPSNDDWHWGDPLSSLPLRHETAAKNPTAGFTWGDPLSSRDYNTEAKTTSAAGWTWGDPLPSW